MSRARIGIAALVVIALIAAPAVLPGTYYTYLAIIVFIYGIVAIGLNILAGYAGQLSLGHAALMAVGAYTTALLSKALAPVPFFTATGLHIWLGIVVGTVAAALFGALLAIPALRVRGPYLAMVTIAFGWVIFKILQEWSSVTGGDLGISGVPKPRIASLTLIIKQYYYVVLAMFIVALAAQYRLVTSQFGLRLRAMKYSEIGVASVGVNVFRVKVAVFTLSAAFAGLGGALFAHQQNYISPDNFQFFSSVFFLLAVLFGGAGTLLGPIIGAAVLTLLPEMLHDFDTYRLIVYGVFILITLYLLPNGVMGALDGRGRKTLTDRPAGASAEVAPRWIAKAEGAMLEVRNISRSFGGLQALRNVSVQIAPGSVHALIGSIPTRRSRHISRQSRRIASISPLLRTPYAASDIWMAGMPRRGMPGTNPAPPFECTASGLMGLSPAMPVPCSNWIFSSSVISFTTIAARSSGDRVEFDQG